MNKHIELRNLALIGAHRVVQLLPLRVQMLDITKSFMLGFITRNFLGGSFERGLLRFLVCDV
jgi:hypothetical protein